MISTTSCGAKQTKNKLVNLLSIKGKSTKNYNQVILNRLVILPEKNVEM